MRYGKIQETNQSAEDFRKDTVLYDIDRGQFGNGGFSKEMVEFLRTNKEEIQDIFCDSDTVYILPASKQFAADLFNKCIGEKDSYDDYSGIADEIDWLKLGKRYWLRLWWD